MDYNGEYEHDMGQALRALLEHAERYATAYKREFDTQVGEDYVLGPEFAAILGGIHGLLNGPTGSVDCGLMSQSIHRLGEWAQVLDKNGELP